MRFLYLNIFFAIIYSTLTIITAPSITPNIIVKVIMMSAAVIFVGYILDSKSSDKNKNKKKN